MASTNFTKDEAHEILAVAQSPQGGEPKFKTLKKTSAGIKRIEAFFRQDLLTPDRVKVDLFHKRYMVITKIVDLIYETLMHNDGIDLYERGGNIALSNLLYFATPVFCGRERFDNTLAAFVRLLRERTEVAARDFYHEVRALHGGCDKKFRGTLTGMLISEHRFDEWFDGIDPLALDPAIPSLFMHMAAWGDHLVEPFDVVHDQSKPIFASRATFNLFMGDINDAFVKIGYDRRMFGFPLRAKSLTFGDSKEQPSLQIADLAAGAAAYWLGAKIAGKTDDELVLRLEDAGIARFVLDAIFPTPAVTPKDLGTDQGGGIEATAAMVDYLSSKIDRY